MDIKQEVLAVIADKVSQAETLIRECEKLADEHGVQFEFSPAYGMGGTYSPTGEKWNYEKGWNPSNQSC